jgi:hypothetical protein
MRTKALLGAAIIAAGLATSMAQNVYSLNVVGYYNVTIPAGGFAMVANQLDTTNNTLAALIPTAPDGSAFIKWNGTSYQTALYDELEPGWLPAERQNDTLNPGEGAFFKNSSAQPLTLTFVGEVVQGNTTNTLPAGFAIRSLVTPQAGSLAGDFGLPSNEDGAAIIKWDTAQQKYSTFLYDELEPGWLPAPGPAVGVGESFWSQRQADGSWVRDFTVPE